MCLFTLFKKALINLASFLTKQCNRCIPYKLEDHNCNMEKTLLVLMVSTPNRDDLVFPKVSIYFLSLNFCICSAVNSTILVKNTEKYATGYGIS